MSISPAEAARLEALYASAFEDLRRARTDLARPKLAEMSAAMPGNPYIARLAQNIAVMEVEWQAARAPYAPAPRDLPSQANVDLVLFHANLARAPSGIHAESIDYMTVLAQSFESARLRAPKARRILITDEETTVPPTVLADEVLRFPMDKQRLMYERMRVQQLYLGKRDGARVTVLMDSDVVVNADPATAFSEAFDIGLTWRPEFVDAPFNGGLILVAEGDAGHAFFGKALACYDKLAADPAVVKELPHDLRAWWGDQFALAAVVGYRAFAERAGAVGEIVDGVRVRYFPCAEYNFTLEPNQRYGIDELRRKFFIHFKGNRKALQAWYLGQMAAGNV